MPNLYPDLSRAGDRRAPQPVVLLPPGPAEHRLLAELAHLRIQLDCGDELLARERTVLMTRIADLEADLRAKGLIAPLSRG